MSEQETTTETTETTEAATTAEPTTFDIPAGQYKARGVEGSEQFGAGEKGDQASVELVLVDLGRTVTTILHFSDAAAPYSIDRLRLMGVPIGPDNQVESFAGVSKNEVPVIVRYEEYNGEMRMKVEIISTRFSFKTPMSDVEKRGFFSRLNQIAAQRGGPSAGGGAPAASAGAAYPTNWDEKPADAARPPLKIA